MGQPIHLETRVRQARDLLDAEIGGQTVMMSIGRGKYYVLDPIGTEIWDLLKKPRTVRELCDEALPRFDVERSRGEEDIVMFVRDLHQSCVIDLCEGE